MNVPPNEKAENPFTDYAVLEGTTVVQPGVVADPLAAAPSETIVVPDADVVVKPNQLAQQPVDAPGDYMALDGITATSPPQVEVVAPTDMPGGYQFVVDVGGRPMVVAVPEGGVKDGQVFRAAIVDQEALQNDGRHNIPVGKWRDGIFDFCAHGICHPNLCLSLWMTPLALGQVLTRMKLDWTGRPLPNTTVRHTMWSAFLIMAVTFVVYQAVDNFLYYLTHSYIRASYDEEDGYYHVPIWAAILNAFRHAISVAYGFFILLVTIRARYHIRSAYSIPEQFCTGCEDACCAVWCGCCAVCQMARHTADYNRYKADCCSETGLDSTAPAVV